MKRESLSMVAAATGFADQSHFTRTFKRVTGATPHEWHRNRTPRGCDMKLMKQGRVSHTAL